MTDNERTQLEKDVLYNEHKTKAEFNACVVKLQQIQERIQKWSEHLRTFIAKVERAPIDDARQWRSFPDVDPTEVVNACDDAIAAKGRLDGIQAQKQKLGL